jgi:hypothetical protein
MAESRSKTAASKPAAEDTAPTTEAPAEAQKTADAEMEQGFRGVEVDPTPNEHYTVDGVTAGKPTPETDPEHAEQVRRHLAGA